MSQSKTIITIPPSNHLQTPKSQFLTRRVAGYARVSTEKDEQISSYESQIKYYEEYITNNPNWKLVKIYSDEGISGCNIQNRPGFKSMIKDALEGKIDLIISKSISRFARNTIDSLTTIRQLKEHNVEVYFEKENIYTFDSKGELLITIMSSLAQEESRSISANVNWGIQQMHKSGRTTLPFSEFLGYSRGPNGEMIIDKEEAKTVKYIYNLFLEGHTPYKIAKILESKSIPSPVKKNKWYGPTITRILSNERYKGDILIQKTITTDFLTKKKVRNTGQLPQYYVKNDHPAIITPEIFDKVQKELEERKGKPKHVAYAKPFEGKFRCAYCGSPFHKVTWHKKGKPIEVWICAGKYKMAAHPPSPHFSIEQLYKILNSIGIENTSCNKWYNLEKILIDSESNINYIWK